MRSALLHLESFDGDRLSDGDTTLTAQQSEALRAAAYEEGYRAGWADALEQHRTDDHARRAAAEEALQTLAFGFHEARDGLERCVMDMAAQMIDRLLPDIVPDAMPRLLERELRSLAARHLNARLDLLCAPAMCDALGALAARVPGLDVTIVPEPSFSDAQVQMRVDQTTRMIDLDAVLAVLRGALADPAEQKDALHG